MIIVLHGENSFFTKRKRDEIIAEYWAKHSHGLSFFVSADDFDFEDFKAAAETASLFDQKKLMVCKNALASAKENDALFVFLRTKNIKEDNNTVVVFSEHISLSASKNKQIRWLLEKPSVVQESKNLAPAQRAAWAKGEISNAGGTIDSDALELLVSACEGDAWRLWNEIAKLVSYDAHVTKKNVALLVAQESEGEIFEAISALSGGNASAAARHFHALLKQGEDWTRIFAMIVFQFRSILKIRSLLDRGYDSEKIKKATGIHPFAIRKTIPHAQRYTTEQLKGIYRKLLELDLSLKTGKTSFATAAENLILGL
ncbi:DNA polymerase III subunit delta [Candidatus Azambacteria bacterium]|nr:DNA polymerase III subunit delta [Candidatus Azambacteria bacterium]MBI3685412.1 DNA polymerase III subunit delta [Candidatus Azambacteria bacterium]